MWRRITLAPGTKLGLLLVFVIVLPALVYSVYQITSLSDTEELLTAVYKQQLDGVLFSINQYAWDRADAWATGVATLVIQSGMEDSTALTAGFQSLLDRNPALASVFVSDTDLRSITFRTRSEGGVVIPITATVLWQALARSDSGWDELRRLAAAGYRRLQAFAIQTDSTRIHTVGVVFILVAPDGRAIVGGYVLYVRRFIENVLGPRIREAAEDKLRLAVIRDPGNHIIFATGELEDEQVTQRKALWLFPDLSIGIDPGAGSVEQILRDRFISNLVLLLFLDLVLLGGGWFMVRMIGRETELVRVKSDFVSTVSHELRTPLALIRMYAETLEMGRIRDGEKRHHYYTIILRETERLSRLVNNILNFSRIESGRKRYTFREVSLNEVVRGVLSTYDEHVRSQGFTPVIELGDGSLTLRADEEALGQAIINILDNAVKYSAAERFLRVSTGMVDGNVFVEIEDHGIGIPREHQKKVFETFYRVSSGLVHNTKGSGLGLAVVRHIVDAHGGRIDLESSAGKGSRFRLWFPGHPMSKEE
jgi:two-component system phosphate regulon sensor histidine kinase PhoR